MQTFSRWDSQFPPKKSQLHFCKQCLCLYPSGLYCLSYQVNVAKIYFSLIFTGSYKTLSVGKTIDAVVGEMIITDFSSTHHTSYTVLHYTACLYWGCLIKPNLLCPDFFQELKPMWHTRLPDNFVTKVNSLKKFGLLNCQEMLG